MLYGFAFQLRNVSKRTLYQLPGIDHRTLLWGEASIDQYSQKLLKDQPSHILGLGISSSRGRFIRLETVTTNRFRRGFSEGNALQSIAIKTFLQPSAEMIVSTDLKTSWCNLASWKIMRLIT